MTRRKSHSAAVNGKKSATEKQPKNADAQAQEGPLSTNRIKEALETMDLLQKSAVARIMPDNYSVGGGQPGMATATLSRKEKRLRRTSKEMPYGKSWNHIVARGVRRQREKLGLTVSEAAAKVDLHNHTWDAVELGTRPNTTGANLGIILEFLFPKTAHCQALTKLLEIGEPLP